MQLSKHFNKQEFACRCGCDTPFKIDRALVHLLEAVRAHFGAPVEITSGFRCKDHNIAVGSTEKSQHRKGTAADIQVGRFKPRQVADFVESMMPGTGGVGRYSTFTHVDTRSRKARWGRE